MSIARAAVPCEAACTAGSVSQEVLEALIDEGGVCGVGATACKMAPYSRNDAQFGVRHAFDLPRVVLRREVEVFLGWHHNRACLDGAECAFGVAVEPFRQADVPVLPGPEHRQEVVGVAFVQEEALPEAYEEVFE